ncbi:hypothetical protein D3C75_757980 [compost metagenome]
MPTETVAHEENLEFEIPEVIIKFSAAIMDREHSVVDFDYSRIDIDSSEGEFVIRTWNITEDRIDWTLFKMITNEDGSGHGEEIKSGVTILTPFK